VTHVGLTKDDVDCRGYLDMSVFSVHDGMQPAHERETLDVHTVVGPPATDTETTGIVQSA